MIADLLNTSAIYKGLGKNFEKAFDFLLQTDLNKLPLGKHAVDGEQVYATVSEYNTKSISNARWEAHRLYADIQLLIESEEKIGFAPLAKMTISEHYNPEKDISFFEGSGEYLTLKPGMFAIFFPHDAHQPGIATGDQKKVKKVVIKVRV